MSRWSRICLFCISEGVPKRSLAVAFVVGTLLNLINQGDALLGHSRLDFVKLLLTFAVPYCVATYGAVSYRLRAETQKSAAADGGDSRARSPSTPAESSDARSS